MLYLGNIATLVIESIKDEWTLQGHHLTGAFEESLRSRVTETAESVKVEIITDKDYAMILERGVAATNIPFSPGSGAKTSKYIAGLTNYAKQRMGASDKDAVSIAFAIAHKHKKEGMPTEASRKFSKTGRRIGFIEDMDKKIKEELKDEIINTINGAVNKS